MENNELQRGLSARQIQMIALGGTIGVGLFMGATSTIKWTGPSVILAYLIAGIFLFLIMRAMGEMIYLNPTTGSFATFASDYIHPAAGYMTAWSNIFQWIVVGMSEVIAVGEYMKFWFPELPTWIPGVIAILLLMAANLFSVKAFGEFEFWFALIKVVTIILMIIAGFGLIFFGFGNGGHAVGISNLWTNGGFMPNGIVGFFFALSIVIGSYQGVELIGITAGETKDPQKNIVKAVNGVIWRILIFYLGAIFVIVSVYPWNQLGDIGSPFVATFAKIGITFAAGLINFVVLTAAMSGCNSGIFSASRMILFSHLRFRKLHPEELEGHPFKMPGGAVTNYLTILFLILVLVGMVFNVETRISVLIGVIFLTIVTIYYFIRYNKNNVKAK